MTPKISVIMSVYNGARYMERSINSILQQTYRDFEFLIVNDGSTDETLSILGYFQKKDSRIIVIDQQNSGLTKALNHAISKAKGIYIARQDADDFSYPRRFQIQIDFMESQPDVVLLGGNSDDIYENGYTKRWGYESPDRLAKTVFLKTPFPHSTVMMKADVCRQLRGYDESFITSQDMDLWMRMARHGKIAMIEEPILQRTIGSGSISVKRRRRQFYDAMRSRWRHNQGMSRWIALYFGIRSFLINMLPESLIQSLRFFTRRS